MPPRRKQKKQSLTPLYLIAAGALLIIAVLIWVAVSGRSTGVTNTNTNGSTANIQRVALTDAKAAFDQGSAVFLDVRAKESFDVRHVTGALSIPLGELEGRLSELNQADWIIPYCT